MTATNGWVGNGPLSGARAGDRFALALISLALDEVDAPERLAGRPCPWGPVASQGCYAAVVPEGLK
jgi:hypothetical protein